VIWLVRPKETSADAVTKWEAKAKAAFQPLVDDVPDLVKGSREWQSGDRTPEAFGETVRKALADFVRTRERVSALKPSPKAPQAGELYENSAQLYVEVGRLYEVLLATDPGDMRTQVDLLSRRVRELADRAYDRGHAAVAPYLDEAQTPNVEIHLPEEVPMWMAEGLAAGPPLDDPPGPPAEAPPLRQEKRPQQSTASWAVAVRAAGIPAARELDDAVAGGDATQLRQLATRFGAAAENLRDKPDPKGDRDRSAVLRLALLVDSEAARTAQAAAVLHNGSSAELTDITRVLARVGEDMLRETRP
jgi:hypothetical protein